MIRNLARYVALRRAGVHVAWRGVRVDSASKLERGSRLAHDVELLDTVVGRFTSIGRYTKCHFADIGPFGSIAWDTTIGATGHPLDRSTTHAFPYRREIGLVENDVGLEHPRVVVGPDVWIGCHVVVMPGVTIGPGAVIGAGSVVTADVPPYAVVAGSPARTLRQRISPDLIEQLTALAWWDWPEPRIRRAASIFRRPLDLAAVEELRALAAD